MSLIRPELARQIHRWREPLIWAAVALAGTLMLLAGLSDMAWLQLALGAAMSGVAVAFFVVSTRRIRLSDDVLGEGVVQIDEGRIAFFGPLGGAFIDVASLQKVEITRHFWCLSGSDGTQVWIPRGASGVENLPDALSVLPGITLAPETGVLWSRSRQPSQPVRRLTVPPDSR